VTGGQHNLVYDNHKAGRMRRRLPITAGTAGIILVIDSGLPGPGGTPAPFGPSLITPYALRHSYAQRHADVGVPADVLKELMDHASVTTTMGQSR
jgi:integrase